MRFSCLAGLFYALTFGSIAAIDAHATLTPSADGKTVYDSVLKVNWLAEANLPAPANNLQFGLNINQDGSMDYATAVLWVAALNSMNGGAGYLGHHNWQLPTMPHRDLSCNSTGPMPYQNSFGFGCLNSDMGSLYNNQTSLGLLHPNTAVAIITNAVGPFTNFQPYLYWSDSLSGNNANGFTTFSFNTGWKGSNVDQHYMYALPMIPGKLPGTPPANGNGLQVNPDGQTIYDPVADVTWLANADLAKSQTFGAQCVNADGTQCINPDGSMSHTTALNWINGMNSNGGWLSHTNWQLPPAADLTCGGFHCDGDPMGELYYDQLGLSKGKGVPTPSNTVGPFHNIQPYLYWSSCEPVTGPSPCLATQSDGSPVPAPNFGFSFSFGNGFEGTDVMGNNLYVTVYYPKSTAIDYDGDGKTDISVFRPSTSIWYLNRSTLGFAANQFGAAGDILTPADFTGDGKTDIAVFRPANGTWYVLRSEDNTFYGTAFGANGDIPAPGDYDGDGKADVAVYRPSTGIWYLQQSTAGFSATQFGIAEDKPAVGDFDGDGKADIAVYRPSTGIWYRLNSSNGSFFAIQFGAAGDRIVPADYTGDGKTDVAVWRPSTGTWYVLRSEDLSFYASAFGQTGDLPAPGDYDGDGKADLAVYRPSQGYWYMMRSTSGFNAVQFGTAEDKPTPNAFVY